MFSFLNKVLQGNKIAGWHKHNKVQSVVVRTLLYTYITFIFVLVFMYMIR